MARIYNITSTQETNTVHYIAYNNETRTLQEEVINLKLDESVIPYIGIDEKPVPYFVLVSILEKIRKVDALAVDVIGYESDVQLYGMTEDTFMKIARKIDVTERRDLITRTLKNVSAKYQAFDMTQAKVVEGTYTIPDNVNAKDDTKVLAYLRKTLETDTLKILAVIGKTDVNALYGVDRKTFMNNAVILDKETRKPIIEENE